MKPLAWSFTSLEQFVSCPRQFHEQRVLKRVKPIQGEEAKWGEHVHKVFETYQREMGSTLPADLQEHLPFMRRLADKPGRPLLEQKIALDRELKPCGFFDPDVWFRGVIDFMKVDGRSAYMVDYKTGKPHNKHRQLLTFALFTFIRFPEVDLVNAQYYWTKTCDVTKKVWARKEVPEMWKELIPDLKQYAQAFKEYVWQPRQSGLCRGWCPVQECEFWSARRT